MKESLYFEIAAIGYICFMSVSDHSSVSPARIRISVKVFFFISGLVFATWSSRIPALQQKFHLNNAQLGSLLITLPAGLMISMPLNTWLLSKFNNRSIMLFGALLYVFLLCTIGMASEIWQLSIILFAFGASRNLFNISVNTQSIAVQQLYQKSIIASFHGIWSIAGFAAAAFASVLISFGVLPMQHFIIIGMISVLLMMVSWKTTIKTDPAAVEKKSVFAIPDKTLLKLGIIAFCSMLCEGTMSDWSGIYFSKEIHASKETVSLGYTAYFCCMTIGRFTGDWIANHIGNKRFLQICGVLLTGGAVIIATSMHLIPAILGFMLCGFGVSCIVPFVFSHASKQSQLYTSSAIAAVSTIGYLGFLTGPPIIGFLSQAAGLRISFVLIACLGLIVSLMIPKIFK